MPRPFLGRIKVDKDNTMAHINSTGLNSKMSFGSIILVNFIFSFSFFIVMLLLIESKAAMRQIVFTGHHLVDHPLTVDRNGFDGPKRIIVSRYRKCSGIGAR